MKTKYFYTFILLLIFCTSFAQRKKNHYSLSGGTFVAPQSTKIIIGDVDYMSANFLNDSTYVGTNIQGIIESTNTFKTHIGYYFEARRHFNFKRSSISIGIGVNTTSLQLVQSARFLEQNITLLDTMTVSLPPTTGGPNTFRPCDSFENTIEDVGGINVLNPLIKVSSIYIPISYNYQLIPKKLFVQAGVQIETTFMKRIQRFVDIDRRESPDHVFCEYIITEFEQTEEDLLDNIILKWDARLSYQIHPKVRIDLGVNRNFYYQKFNTFLSIFNAFLIEEYQPFRITAGVSYHFKGNSWN